MELLVRGIYTEDEEMVDIILEENEEMYFIVEIEKEFTTKQDTENFVKQSLKNSFPRINDEELKLRHIKKQLLHSYIDGYLGQMDQTLYFLSFIFFEYFTFISYIMKKN